jgi:hypothetical protein
MSLVRRTHQKQGTRRAVKGGVDPAKTVSDGLEDTVPQSADTEHFYLDSSPAL